MPHRRRNPLTGEWVLVSPQRTARPWQGATSPSAAPARPAHDPACPLCPGTTRATGHRTPVYESTYVFDNDFPALVPEAGPPPQGHPLLEAEADQGICRVVCFSPRHDLDLASLAPSAVRAVVDTWCDETERLGGLDWVQHVQVFENRGAAMGASNPHPHGQIWAEGRLPDVPRRELDHQRAHLDSTGRCLLCDYAATELARGERVVAPTDHFLVVVPWWAVWPFETLLLPRRHCGALPELDGAERDALAATLADLVGRYDRVFDVPFPYSAGWHQTPTDGDHPEWHLHAHLLPPLLRSAEVRKWMVGYELLANPQRDLTPEEAAARLAGVAP